MIIISTLTRVTGLVTGYEKFVLFHESLSSSLNITFKKIRAFALIKLAALLYKYCDYYLIIVLWVVMAG
jgi:hypothetical protein